MEIMYKILEILIIAVQVIAVVVLLAGVVLAIRDLFTYLIPRKRRAHVKHPILIVKIALGRYILLGLEFLIVADIIESIFDPTWQGILMLASIVAIRTIISFFLNHEINETDEKIVERDGDSV